MKRVYIYIAGFIALSAVFSTCYYLSYQNALHKFNQNAVEKKSVDYYVQADTGKIDTITPYTEYILETYDMVTGEKKRSKLNTPESFIGLSRNELIGYLNRYMADLSLEEFQQGMVSFELVSFSTDKVVLSKTYNSDKIKFQYYIVVYEGMVVVYYSDKKTVYEYTGIEANILPEEEQIKLNYGIYVKDEEELYGILENYSS